MGKNLKNQIFVLFGLFVLNISYRDSTALIKCSLPIFALAFSPIKNILQINIRLSVCHTTLVPDFNLEFSSNINEILYEWDNESQLFNLYAKQSKYN